MTANASLRAGALGLVSAATALGFGRVFGDSGFVPLLLLAALLPHAIGARARARNWSTERTVTTTAVVTALVFIWIVAGETTAYGAPTLATAHRLGHLLSGGWGVFRTGVAPVSPRVGVVLLCAIAMATCATVADAIGRRPDVTVGALAPTLILFVLTGTLGTGRLRVPATIAWVVAALVAIVIANSARVAQRRTWFTGRRLGSDASVVRNAAAIGSVALVAGLVLTPLVPGVGSPALLRYRNHTGRGGTGGLGDFQTVSPLVDLRARLGTLSNIELFRVTSPRPLYWRLVALDRFDGQVWSLTSEARDAAATFRSLSDRNAVTQQFAITSLGDQWVPAAFTPVNTTMGNARIIPDSSTLIAPNPVGGQQYEVRSRIEQTPTPAQIARTAQPVPSRLTTALQLPDTFPQKIRDTARSITAGAVTPYGKAQALQHFFADGDFTYDLTVDPTDSSEAIGAFLRIKRGFCQQFAAAFAALARAAGLPSRVVVGFTPGDVDARSGDYVVRGKHAHAWAEVWFAGLGWRTFEPTPAGPAPGQADGRAVPGVQPPLARTPTTSPTTTAAPTTNGGGTGSNSPRRIPRGEIISTRLPHASGDWDARSIALIAAPAVFLAGALGFIVALIARRSRVRTRRRRAPSPTERVAGAWRDALEACAGAGLPVSAALTPREQVRSIANGGAPDAVVPPLRTLAEISTDVDYSPHPPDAAAMDEAWAAASDVRAALLVGVGVRERTRRTLRAGRVRVPSDRGDEAGLGV